MFRRKGQLLIQLTLVVQFVVFSTPLLGGLARGRVGSGHVLHNVSVKMLIDDGPLVLLANVRLERVSLLINIVVGQRLAVTR